MSHFAPGETGRYGPAGSSVPPAGRPPAGWRPSGPPGWQSPAWPQAPRRTPFAWSRLAPTLLVAFVVAAVVLGGIGLDYAIAAPTAGTLTVGGDVRLTAAPGWVLTPTADGSAGIELRRADAMLTAQVVSTRYTGTSSSLLAEQRPSLDAEAAQISYGEVHATTINGYETSFVVFQATVVSQHSGVLDGELVSMIVNRNALVVFVAARQGHLDPVIADVTAMLESIGPAR